MSKLYIAYGSNMNIQQMSDRCPTAKVKGVGIIMDWELVFRGVDSLAYATIEPLEKSEVPVLIWKIETLDEKALDEYEEYPSLYRKEIITVIFQGEAIETMGYIMNEGRPMGVPSPSYYDTISQGYKSAGIDEECLERSHLKAKRA